MDIRSWPLDRIMQLPDHCFGRRWPVGVGFYTGAGISFFDISEAALPERCVIWGLAFAAELPSTGDHCTFSFSLGDILPTTLAEFNAFDVLFRDFGYTVTLRRAFTISYGNGFVWVPLRYNLESGGKRLVTYIVRSTPSVLPWAAIVVSSVPTEVPDWMISGPARSP